MPPTHYDSESLYAGDYESSGDGLGDGKSLAFGSDGKLEAVARSRCSGAISANCRALVSVSVVVMNGRGSAGLKT